MPANIHPLALCGRRGFTIVEIVIACIIIGILTLTLVPTLTGQTNQARINTAMQDLENLANAEERAAVDTGYLYRPYVLNDGRGGDAIANAPAIWPVPAGQPIDRVQGVRDNSVTMNNVYNYPNYIFISPQTQDFVATIQQQILFIKLAGSLAEGDLQTNLRAEEMFHWNGPYINWKRDNNHDDWPDDPWGNNYVFFTKMGMICAPLMRDASGAAGSNAGGSGGSATDDMSYPFQILGPYYNLGGSQVQYPGADASSGIPLFDRPTWVSLGPNGIPGSPCTKSPGTPYDPTDYENFGYGKGDDLVYSFGGS